MASRSSATVRTSAADNPHRNLQLEHYLRKNGVLVNFFDEVPLERFHVQKSRANQSRHIALHDEAVAKYADSIERGVALPAIVTYKASRTENAKLIIIDGNHRLAAYAKLDLRPPTYVLHDDTASNMIQLLTFTLNVGNGLPLTQEEAIDHALGLHYGGMSVADAAKQLGIGKSALDTALQKRAAHHRVDRAGADRRAWESLRESVQLRLHNIGTDDGFAAAILLAHEAGLTLMEVATLVKAVNEIPTGTRGAGAEQVKVVTLFREGEFRQKIQQNASGVMGIGRAGKARGGAEKMHAGLVLSRLNLLPVDPKMLRSMYPASEREEKERQFREAAAKLSAIADALRD
ncbi:MAG TPA: ParB/Srx family N-terminal domain-containing protein [Pedococcus sp.]|nr:ParB/Srx family N-terminal domain-containing protein [Pedococcus sp.]